MVRKLKHLTKVILTALLVSATNTYGQNDKVIIQLADSLSQLYVFEEKGSEMAKMLKSNLDKGTYENLNEEDLAEQLDADLKKIVMDKHLKIFYGQPNRPANQRRSIPNYSFLIGESKLFEGNIGYMEITGFRIPNQHLKEHLSDQLKKISDCKSIILDLRNNGGGAPEGVQLLASHFFENDSTKLLNTVEYRGYDVKYDYHVLGDNTIERILNKKIYILTSDYTFSAGEGFAYSMQANNRAVIVGEKTGGGAHPVKFYPLKNGIIAKIPIGRAINPITKSNWEAVGVIPDIEVDENDALQKAIEDARKL